MIYYPWVPVLGDLFLPTCADTNCAGTLMCRSKVWAELPELVIKQFPLNSPEGMYPRLGGNLSILLFKGMSEKKRRNSGRL